MQRQSSIKTFFYKRSPPESDICDCPSKRHDLNKGGEIENENIFWEDDMPTSDSEDEDLTERVSTYTKPAGTFHSQIKPLKQPLCLLGRDSGRKQQKKMLASHNMRKVIFIRYPMCTWKDFEEHIARGKSIAKFLTSAHDKTVAENRQYIKEVAKVLCLTARQKIAQSGYHEGPDSMNKGNFLEIMELIIEKDPIIKARLSSKNAKYTSPTIQNEIIGIMAETVLNEITDELYQSTWFSTMVDELEDISGREQLSVVVRYLFDHTLHEEFLGFVRLHELNAEYLKSSIREMLLTCSTDAKNRVGQTYDGVSVMSGTNAGVQRLFREEAAPEATYIHCYNHRLNLVIVDVVKSVKIADQFFGLLESICVHVISCAARVALAKTKQAISGQTPQKLKKLSDTRWACQYAACKVMLLKLPAILQTLEEVTNEYSGKRATDAAGLLNAVNFSLIISLVVFEYLLHTTKLLSDMLESLILDVAAAGDMVETLHDELEQERDGSNWDIRWSKAKDMAKELDIPVRFAHKSGRKRQQSSMLDGFATNTTLG
ncbi:zinc finger MYM-type protein 1-like [Macrobrachium rosenbergii]|uniref:zinc finger MYM-type protein 1-like n=1 Tax=Macrobrachium rosenbergii TaxID=79674 RepID=UPI0034D3E78B